LGAALLIAAAGFVSTSARADEPKKARKTPDAAETALASSASAPTAPAATPDPAKTTPDPAQPISPARRALATAAAVIPGVFLHGSGHFVAGKRPAAYRLLAMEGIGFAMAGGGLSILAATGASRRFSAPLVGITALGAGLFLISGLADFYGVLAPDEGTGAPLLGAPIIETQLGVRYVYNPTFSYRAILVQSIDLRWGPLRLMPSASFALDDVNARLRALASYRIGGPTPRARERGKTLNDGSFFDIEGAATNHSYAEGFAITTLEASLHGRLDAERIAPSLRGSFMELGAGGGIELHRYRGLETEANTILLVRFAYGLYLGRPPSPFGEAMIYYDHRHDDYAAGLKMTGLGSGVPGHFGARGTLFFTPEWGVLADAQVGSAYVLGASMIFRYGASQ
jgi:hypothetical protein